MKFDRSYKFNLICYYGQVNFLPLKSSLTSKWASTHIWGHHLFCWRRFQGALSRAHYRMHPNVSICCSDTPLLGYRQHVHHWGGDGVGWFAREHPGAAEEPAEGVGRELGGGIAEADCIAKVHQSHH